MSSDVAPRDALSRRRSRGLRAVLGSVLVLIVVVGWPSTASAHPLGNFTVNRYARIEVSAGRVRVYYVLDEAEIPAFQERGAIRADRRNFLRRRVAQIGANLRLTVDGKRLALRPVGQSLDQPPGQGGLNTLRVAAVYNADLPRGGPDDPRVLTFADRNEPDRIGWREIVAVARSDARLLSSDAPKRDTSDELRRYPANLVKSPLDLRSATVKFTPGSKPIAGAALPRSARPPTRSGGSFVDLITRQNLNPGVLAGMYGLALLVGAGHAVLPGHGKTIMAAYLVGTKGRPVDAVLLGVIVSLMHTFSVLVLGLVLFKVSRSVSVEQIYPQLTVASGVLAMAFGAWLLSTRIRTMRRVSAVRAGHAHDADHPHDADHAHETDHAHADQGNDARHAHEPVAAGAHVGASASPFGTVRPLLHAGHGDEGHGHGGDGHDHDDHPSHGRADDLQHGHHHGPGGHTHELPEDVAPLSRRGLIVLATSGGIVPSPSAVIVVVSAFSIGRVVLGLSLIAAFSVGLAVTLTAIGLALVFGRSVIDRRWPNRSFRYLPLAGAAALIVAGGLLAVRGLSSLG